MLIVVSVMSRIKEWCIVVKLNEAIPIVQALIIGITGLVMIDDHRVILLVGWATLSRLCLVEYFGDHQFSIFFFLRVSQVVLMHHPISLFGFLLPAMVSVEDKDFLEPFNDLDTIWEDWAGLSCLVPPCFDLLIRTRMDFSSFSGTGGVSLGRTMEEVTDLTIFAYPCKTRLIGCSSQIL